METIRSRRLGSQTISRRTRVPNPPAACSHNCPMRRVRTCVANDRRSTRVFSTGKSGSAIEELNRFNCQMYVAENEILTSDDLDRLESQELASNQRLATIPHQQWCTLYPLEVLTF